MVPAPSCPDTWDYWTSSPSEEVELTCLLPNSIYIPLKVSWDYTLINVKTKLWNCARSYPMFGMLHEMSGYVFQFVNSLAAPEEVDDENKRLRDIKPVCGVLMIIEKSVKRPGEQLLNTQISHIIGKGLYEFDSLRSTEVNDFRKQMRYLAEESLMKRLKSTWQEQLRYQCPPRLASQPLPSTWQGHLNQNCFLLVTKYADPEFTSSLRVPITRTPQQHIEIILRKQATSLNMRTEHASKYVLKVCGREEYLFGDYPLIQFQYIQDMLSRDLVPEVMTKSIDTLQFLTDSQRYRIFERDRLTSDHSNTMREFDYESSWKIDKNYSCTIHSVGGVNVDPGRVVEVICQAGIFHGGKALCEAQKTSAAAVSINGVAQWNEELKFPIKVYNLPRMARLCFGIYEIIKVKSKKRGKDIKDSINKLAWANTMIFDYKDQLPTDGMTLYMSTHVADETQGDDQLLHPLGTVLSNPNPDSCAALQIQFSSYDCQLPIMYPKPEVVRAFAERVEISTPDAVARLGRDFEKLRADAERDPMYEMHEQDKKNMWALRNHFRTEAPALLPRLLSCVEWGDRAEVASVARMLCDWKTLPLESALELLDYAYADAAVRSFAVKCLQEIDDEDLLLYLLQLVQALKHESYLMCDLSVFLLQKAFKNMIIGHYLFWHLRSEMHMPSVSVRFGLMLEAYLRGCQDHINSLLRQIACLDKLKWASKCIRKKKEISKARSALQKHLREPHCEETLSDFVSPLNPSYVCKKINPDRCRVMDSKMRPMMVDFENADTNGSDIRIIFKMGDDLRQDMFTLQMLRIMDKLWKRHGYDLRLSPYNCISMENEVGMIEVVEDAETVANIQKQSAPFNAASTINKTALLQWLKKQTEDEYGKQNEAALNKAVEEFRMSCAGYCVATYVLGIADRHPDNIMVKKSGQLFHIDFGHFLGHFKQKYGFKRERVPFVLTHDFIHVINKGQRGSGDNDPINFKIFREYCEKAFKILRQNGHLILSLFSMMISTGLRELSSEKDLQYLRETLVMHLSEEKAMEHFRSKFNEAVKNSWTTTFSWAFHNLDKNN